ncbi:MAG: 30S ribosomal protein S16 [Rickettsiales bacterium]|nr:30S ribosomal protein S16 [Rickettsiales bacterium]
MAVKLRLARHGATHRPFYWLVAASSRFARDGRYLEKLGTYNPILPTENSERLTLNQERVKYWLSVGAQPSERVIKLLSLENIDGIDKFKNKKKSTIGKPKTTKNPDKRRSTQNKEEQPSPDSATATTEQSASQKNDDTPKTEAQKTNNATEQQEQNIDHFSKKQDSVANTEAKENSSTEKSAKDVDNVTEQQKPEEKDTTKESSTSTDKSSNPSKPEAKQ